MKRWEIVNGDCLEHLARIGPGSADLVFADSPYNLAVDYGGGAAADKLPAKAFLAWCQEWMSLAARTLSQQGSFWVLINDENADEFGCMLRKTGLKRKNWIVWFESFGVNVRRGFNRCSRHLFYMVKDLARCIFNRKAVNRPSDRQAIYGDKRASPDGKNFDSVWGVNPPIPRLTGTCAERIEGFPTQLPLALLTPIVGCSSRQGSLVVDPFAGSGTTGEAALRLKRRFLGIEKSAVFAARASERLTAV